MTEKPRKQATLRQVAAHAGVSAATVSLVLNNKGDISEATRDKVMLAAEALNYVPRAPRARPEVTNTIRFLKIARHGQTVNRDHNHFISDYIDGMSYEAGQRSYSLQVVSFEHAEFAAIEAALAGPDLRGIVVLGTELSDEDIRQIAASCRLPIVFIDTYHPFLSANFVDMDNDQLVFEAISHLMARGFRRIGFVDSSSDVTNFHLRRSAFDRATRQLGLEVSPDWNLRVVSTLDGAFRDSCAQLRERTELADAYFCANDIIAFGFIRALHEHGRSVPGDVSVVGFDNLPMASVFDPPLTSINVPKRHIGAQAIRLLDNLVQSGMEKPNFKVLMTGDLQLRQSVREAPDHLDRTCVETAPPRSGPQDHRGNRDLD